MKRRTQKKKQARIFRQISCDRRKFLGSHLRWQHEIAIHNMVLDDRFDSIEERFYQSGYWSLYEPPWNK